MQKKFTIISFLFIMLVSLFTILATSVKSNAGFYRSCGVYGCRDTGRVNNYGEKRCPNGYRIDHNDNTCEPK